MREWADKRPRWLIPLAMAMLALAATGRLWHDPGAKPVTAPALLFEMLVALLLIGTTGACARF